MPNGVQQMRLTQAHVAIDEERIVGPCRMPCYRQTGGMGKLITGTDHKRLKGKPEIEGRSARSSRGDEPA